MSVWIRLRNLSPASEVVPKLIFLWITKPLIHRSASLLVKGIDVFLRKTHKLSLCLSSNLHRPRYRLIITPVPLLNQWSNDFVVCAFAASTVNNPIHLARNDVEYGKWRSSANIDVCQYKQYGHRHYNPPFVEGCVSHVPNIADDGLRLSSYSLGTGRSPQCLHTLHQ